MDVTSDIVTLIIDVHLSNTYDPMDVTHEGMSIDKRPVHPAKALFPIDVRLFIPSAKLIYVMPVHELKAYSSIDTTVYSVELYSIVFGMIMFPAGLVKVNVPLP